MSTHKVPDVGPKDPASRTDPRPADPRQDPGLEKSWTEAGGYAGEAVGKLIGSELGESGKWAGGEMGRAAGETAGGGLGAAADWVINQIPYQPVPDGDGGMCQPEQGAGMSSPQAASIDADNTGQAASVDTSQDPAGGISTQPANSSVDPGMSAEPPMTDAMDMAQGQ